MAHDLTLLEGTEQRAPRGTLEQRVYEQLRRDILDGQLEAGRKLIQEDLAAELGASRIPIRDALKRLEMDGLVEPNARGTYRVLGFGPEDISEIYGLRLILEPYAVREAADAITPEHLARLMQLLDDMRQAATDGDASQYVESNYAFHMSIYELSGNARLMRFIRGLWVGRPRFTPLEITGRYEDSIREHETILAALIDGDGETARLCMELHIRRSSALLRQRLAERKSGHGRSVLP